MSLDGYVAGPIAISQHPLGVGGMQLHEWAFPLAAGVAQRAGGG